MQQDLRRPSALRDRLAGAPRDPLAFAEWVANQSDLEGLKLELSRGRIVVMQLGMSLFHNRISRALVRLLETLLQPEAWEIYFNDFAVVTPVGARYPDIMVEPVRTDQRAYAGQNSVFLAEILSPSDPDRDFVEKTEEYTGTTSLGEYLILSQGKPKVWLWSRGADAWPRFPRPIEGRDAMVRIAGLDIELPLAEIYRGIPDADPVT